MCNEEWTVRYETTSTLSPRHQVEWTEQSFDKFVLYLKTLKLANNNKQMTRWGHLLQIKFYSNIKNLLISHSCYWDKSALSRLPVFKMYFETAKQSLCLLNVVTSTQSSLLSWQVLFLWKVWLLFSTEFGLVSSCIMYRKINVMNCKFWH